MNAIDLKRVEFRHYLESCGVLDALSYALIKLYDEIEKPADPVAFVRQHFKRPNDENDYTAISKPIGELDASELMRKQQHELNLARMEITKLQQMLNSMSADSSFATNKSVGNRDDSNAYSEIFRDRNYENTLIKKYLTEEQFKKLLEQNDGPSIIDCIVKVDAIAYSPCGVRATNSNCYTKFTDLFEPIIKDIHCVDELNKHPDCDWGDESVFQKFDNKAIVSIEMSCSRSLANIPFIPGISESDLQIILSKVQDAIQSTRSDDNEIDGEFYKITDVNDNEPISRELQDSGLGFRSMNPHDHILWPTGRGLYINCARTQSILINEQEHLRFVSKEMNGDFGLVYKNLVKLIQTFGSDLEFERNDKFGWLTSNLESVGTGICCKIRLKFKQPFDSLEKICNESHIKINSLNSNDTENVIELTNLRAFGFSEFECVHVFYESVKRILQILRENEAQIKSIQQNTNESNSPEVDDNRNEVNNENNGNEINAENEQLANVASENVENDEMKIEEKTDDETQEKTEVENASNEQVANEEMVNKEKLDEENVTNAPEPIASNENTDNLAERVIKGNDAIENDEANPNDTNENEANQNEIETPDKPDDTANQVVNDADGPNQKKVNLSENVPK